jgi:hypothetical protein
VVIHLASPTASSPTRNFTPAPMVIPIGPAGAHGETRRIGATSVVAFADSLPLSDGVTLQLYGGYDAQERFTGTRLRSHDPSHPLRPIRQCDPRHGCADRQALDR